MVDNACFKEANLLRVTHSVEDVRPLCIGKQAEEEVNHMLYDRHTPLDCLPYSFGRGHLFTQIAFYSAEVGPTGDPEIRLKANNSDDEYYTASDHKVIKQVPYINPTDFSMTLPLLCLQGKVTRGTFKTLARGYLWRRGIFCWDVDGIARTQSAGVFCISKNSVSNLHASLLMPGMLISISRL